MKQKLESYGCPSDKIEIIHHGIITQDLAAMIGGKAIGVDPISA